jgi:hypothetical protein
MGAIGRLFFVGLALSSLGFSGPVVALPLFSFIWFAQVGKP